MTLKNNLAIITGVSTGMGFAAEQAPLDQDVKVAGWVRNKSTIDNNFYFCPTNITDYDAIKVSMKQSRVMIASKLIF